ncbi:MAG: hypothetical protein JNM65_01695 [Verrucomicrobiaceae bacterium]|nr:hypothetical protein [Verrucomicrobiaceae bacterium]
MTAVAGTGVNLFRGRKAHAINPAKTSVIPAKNTIAFDDDVGGSGTGGAFFFMRKSG